jgi:hypothetical protein
MAHEKVTEGSKWAHNKEGYTVIVETSSLHGKTTFRREVGLLMRGSPVEVRKLRSKKTHYFLGEFTKYTDQ